MSGSYQNWSADSPGGLNESIAAVRRGLEEAHTAYSVTQAETAAFLVQYGGDVTKGHAPVGEPGRMGDPDNPLPGASDL